MKQGNSTSWQKHKYINYVLKVRVCFYIALNNLFSHITALERLGNAASWKKNKKKQQQKLQLQVASLEKCRAIKLIFFVFLLENNFSNQFAFLTWDRLSSLNTVISHTAGCHPSVCNFPIRQDVIPQHANFPYGRQYGRMSSLNMQISHTSGCHPSNTTTI